MFAGRLGGPRGAKDAAEAADATPPGAQPVRPVDLLLDGMATLITRGHVVGVPKLQAALGSIQSEVQRSGGDVLRWLWLAFPIAQETAAHELWDDESLAPVGHSCGASRSRCRRVGRSSAQPSSTARACMYRPVSSPRLGADRGGRSDYRCHRPFAG